MYCGECIKAINESKGRTMTQVRRMTASKSGPVVDPQTSLTIEVQVEQ
jgi:hypothetical protein